MDRKSALAALDQISDGIKLLRVSMLDGDVLPPRRAVWASESHVDEVIARLGVFETMHIEGELNLGKSAARSRIKSAIERGTAVEIRARSNYAGTIYRWTGKKT